MCLLLLVRYGIVIPRTRFNMAWLSRNISVIFFQQREMLEPILSRPRRVRCCPVPYLSVRTSTEKDGNYLPLASMFCDLRGPDDT